ncbi:hypothetical protein EJ110_NYTH07161 [Nymphaea thermarum]|nr:hypothetical protein EJ110_NYTH07161 [Nymphaea thermarum]
MAQASATTEDIDYSFGKLPDHLLIEIFTRLPPSQFVVISSVKKQWATLLKGEPFWQAALVKTWPFSGERKRWPGPISQGPSRRRYAALHATRNISSVNDEIGELMGHVYLFLKEKLENATGTLPTRILHGTVIDQFITCGKSRDCAHELASQIWLAVINNLEENEHTFQLLKHLAERAAFLPDEYRFSSEVQGRIFEKLFTDFRDCLVHGERDVMLACARSKFHPIPCAWLGY